MAVSTTPSPAGALGTAITGVKISISTLPYFIEKACNAEFKKQIIDANVSVQMTLVCDEISKIRTI